MRGDHGGAGQHPAGSVAHDTADLTRVRLGEHEGRGQETCEKSTGEDGHKVRFETPDEFLAWFEERRPKAFKKYSDRRAKLLRTRARAASRKPAGQASDEVPAAADAR